MQSGSQHCARREYCSKTASMTAACLTALSFVSMIVHMRDRLIADAGAWTQSLGIMSGADAPRRRGVHASATRSRSATGSLWGSTYWHPSSLVTAGISPPGATRASTRPEVWRRRTRGPVQTDMPTRLAPKTRSTSWAEAISARPTGVVGPADRLLRCADEAKRSRPLEASAGVTSRTVDEDACPLRDGRRAKPIAFSVRNVPRRQPVSSGPEN
jgi:hypothetical protein